MSETHYIHADKIDKIERETVTRPDGTKYEVVRIGYGESDIAFFLPDGATLPEITRKEAQS